MITSKQDRGVIAAMSLYLLILTIFGAGSFPSVFAITTIGICMVAAWMCCRSARTADAPVLPDLPICMAVLAMTLIVCQCIPLPAWTDALFGHPRQSENAAARALLTQLSAAGDIPVRTWFAASRNVPGSIRIVLLIGSCLAVALLALTLSRGAKSRFAIALICAAGLIAVLGIVHQRLLPKPKTLWWFYEIGHGQPIGCFPNRTHHAGFLALFAPPAITWAADALRRKHYRAAACGILTLAAIGAGVFLSLSRGGLVALATGTGITLCTWMLRSKGKRVWALGVVGTSIACCVAALALAPPQPVEEAIERTGTLRQPLQTASAQSRFSVWGDAVTVWKQYPLFGCGANGFRHCYPQIRSLDGRKTFSHVENEYIQLLAELGVTGLLLVLCVVVWMVPRLARCVFCEPGTPNAALRMALPGILGAVAVHNAVDFPLHAPLYAASVVALLCLCAGSPALTSARPRQHAAVMAGVVLMTLLATRGLTHTSTLQRDYGDYTASAPLGELVDCIEGAPGHWDAWYRLSDELFKQRSPEQLLIAEACMVRATQLNPGNYTLWRHLGWLRTQIGDPEGARSAYRRMQNIRPWLKIPTPGKEAF